MGPLIKSLSSRFKVGRGNDERTVFGGVEAGEATREKDDDAAAANDEPSVDDGRLESRGVLGG